MVYIANSKFVTCTRDLALLSMSIAHTCAEKPHILCMLYNQRQFGIYLLRDNVPLRVGPIAALNECNETCILTKTVHVITTKLSVSITREFRMLVA